MSFKVVLTGERLPHASDQDILLSLSRRDDWSDNQIEQALSGQTLVVAAGLEQTKAESIVVELREIGLDARCEAEFEFELELVELESDKGSKEDKQDVAGAENAQSPDVVPPTHQSELRLVDIESETDAKKSDENAPGSATHSHPNEITSNTDASSDLKLADIEPKKKATQPEALTPAAEVTELKLVDTEHDKPAAKSETQKGSSALDEPPSEPKLVELAPAQPSEETAEADDQPNPLQTAQQRLDRGRCPKCGHTPSGPFDPDGTCEICGVIPRKYLDFITTKEAEEIPLVRRPTKQPPKTGATGATPRGESFGIIRWAKRGSIAVAVLLLASIGFSLFNLPTHELTYQPETPAIRCADASDPKALILELTRLGLAHQAERCSAYGDCGTTCRADYRLRLGNTGIKSLPQVVVRLDETAVVTATPDSPAFFDFDGVPREARSRDYRGIRSFAIGSMASLDKVDMRLSLVSGSRGDFPSWPELLDEIAIPSGEVHEGSPQPTLIGRTMRQILSAFSPRDAEQTVTVFLDDGPDEDAAQHQTVVVGRGVDLALSEIEWDDEDLALATAGELAQHHVVSIRNRGSADATDVKVRVALHDGFRASDARVLFELVEDDTRTQSYEVLAFERRNARGGLPCQSAAHGVECHIELLRPHWIGTLSFDVEPVGQPSEHAPSRASHKVWIESAEQDLDDGNNRLELTTVGTTRE